VVRMGCVQGRWWWVGAVCNSPRMSPTSNPRTHRQPHPPIPQVVVVAVVVAMLGGISIWKF